MIVVVKGDNEGARQSLNSAMDIGRDFSCDMRLVDDGVSRLHARVEPDEDGGWVIRDLESTNGVRINGQLVTEGRIVTGDRVDLGASVTLLFTRQGRFERGRIRDARLKALGSFASSVAHDFNTVLSSILTNAEYLAARHGEMDSDFAGATTDIQAAAKNGRRLVESLMLFAAERDSEHFMVDAGDIVEEAMQMVRHAKPPGVALRVVDSEGLYVLGSRTRLVQVVMNLVSNAFEAFDGDDGVVSVTCRRVEIGPDDAEGQVLSPGAWILLEIVDTGPGMDSQTAQRVFEPFFTTRGSAGNGIGLSTVYGIVQGHGGVIDLRTEVGQGACFQVFLPALGLALVEPSFEEPTIPVEELR